MRALVMEPNEHRGTFANLHIADVPAPTCESFEVRVDIHAVGANRADLLQRAGVYPAPAFAPANILGLEFSGVVESIGARVTRFSIGDRVFGLAAGGAYAEQIVTHERTLTHMPANLSFVDAASLPEACITACDALFNQAHLQASERVLVSAVGSGVGLIALQIGKALGAFVLGTARTPEKLDAARALGLDIGIVAKEGKFADEVLRVTSQSGVDIALELVGGEYVDEDLRCLATRGRIVVVGLLAGARTGLNLGLLLNKRARIIGTVLRSRPLEEKIKCTMAFEKHVVPLIEQKKVQAVIEGTFDLDQADEAHARLAANKNTGKLVLIVRR